MENLEKYQPGKEESQEEEEEIATHMGEGDPLIGHFTMANLSSEEEED